MIPVTELSSLWLRSRILGYFSGKFRGLRIYWSAYGRFGAVLKSPFLHFATLLGIVLYPMWWVECAQKPAWVEFSKAVLPSMIAFSLGALAIIFTVNSGPFFDVIRKSREGEFSYYVKVMASFAHFIMLQVLAVVGSMVAFSFPLNWISLPFFILFLYAVLSAIAAVGSLIGLADLRGRSG